ncbi:MAG: T9SS type A sorting domain-containing protein, partial [Hymenobacter sp.]
SIDSPTDWLTADNIASATSGISIPTATGTYTKTTDAHTGIYAARLETKATAQGAASGAVSVGTRYFVRLDLPLPGGIPFTSRPAKLQFFYKLSGAQPAVASEGAYAQVALMRRVGGSAQLIASAKQVLTTPTSTYTLVEVPLSYTSSATPDSVFVLFSSGSRLSASAATVGTVFQVDDVSFTGTALANRDAALSETLTVAPNPSSTGRYVLTAPAALLAAPLTVVDMTGRVVLQEGAPKQVTSSRVLNLVGLAKGLYTLHLMTEQGLVTKKIVID